MNSRARFATTALAVVALAAATQACGLATIVSTAFTTNTVYVVTGGDDSRDCLSPSTACRTVDAALTKTTGGLVVIQLGPGTFQEITHTTDPSLHTISTSDGVYILNRVLTLRGTTSGGAIQTTLSGQWGLNAVTVNGIADVTIQDLIIDGGGAAGGTGLQISHTGGGGSNVTVRNVVAQNNGSTGIKILGRPVVTIDGATVQANGAGIDNDGGTLTIENSRIINNAGAGVANSSLGSGGHIDLSNTTVSGNVGAGIRNSPGGTLTVEGSTVSGTRPAGSGSPAYGVYNAGSLATLTNSTVSGNPVGIQAISDLGVSYSTIAANAGAGISAGRGATTAPTVTLLDSIIENNGRQDCSFDPSTPRPAVTVLGAVLSDGSCSPAGFGVLPARAPADAFLGSLADNGGPTFSMALLPGSPAVDAASGDCPATDQRGITRPQGAACDAGAYELEISPTSLIIPALPTPAQTETPAAPAPSMPTTTLTPAPVFSFGPPVISLDHFYFGKGNCVPTTLNLRVSFSDPGRVSSILLFFHLQDKSGGGDTPWNEGVAMTPLGGGSYEHTLDSNDIPAYASYSEARFVYQFVALGPGGNVLLRSDVFNNVTLFQCPK